jgi:hypothetical protein
VKTWGEKGKREKGEKGKQIKNALASYSGFQAEPWGEKQGQVMIIFP